MTVCLIILAIFTAGCVGGFVNSMLAGEMKLPKHDLQAGVYKPGWIGNVLVGGVSALIFWGLYGPMTSVAVIGQGAGGTVAVLHVSELFGALLTGVGGGRLLTSEVEKKLLVRETQQLDQTKTGLTSALRTVIGEGTDA
jgi:hypothetical protein